MKKLYINCSNTGEEKPETGNSWIENYHILRYIKDKQPSRTCIHCGKQEVEGCHVHPFMKNEDIYIVPMCHKCNTSEICVIIDSDWTEPLSEVSKAYTSTPNLDKFVRRIFNNN